MKILFIVPGFEGNFYCQNCIRDLELIQGFRKAGHDAIIAPVYMPSNSIKNIGIETPVFFNAINLYLREKLFFYKYIPSFIKKLLDSEKLLNLVAKKSDSTDPKGMESMTLSVIKGAQGKHNKDLEKLLLWIQNDIKPDIIHLSNILLTGIGDYLKSKTNSRVFVSLQDEDSWIDLMDTDFRNAVWETTASKCKKLDKLIAVSNYYKYLIMNRTEISENKISVVYPGIICSNYKYNKPVFNKLTIGYLSRISDQSGFGMLVDALIIIKKRLPEIELKIRVTGGFSSDDKQFIKAQQKKINKYALTDNIEWVPEMFKNNLNDFFKDMTLLCSPNPHGEAFGLFQLQSLASGIPLIISDKGAYGEVSKLTAGAIVIKNISAEKIADNVEQLIKNKDMLLRLSQNGYENVINNFNITNYVESLLKIYRE